MDAPDDSAIGGTYVGNPVAQAAALAVLDVIDEEGLVEHASALGETMRERMVQHRANPVCASCHSMMDPLGLPLAHFDAIGRWRDVSAGLPARHAMPLVAAPESREVLYAGTMGFGVYARQGTGPWRRLGHGLSGGAHTVLALAMTAGSHPTLLAGTGLGLFRYAPPG